MMLVVLQENEVFSPRCFAVEWKDDWRTLRARQL